MNPNPRALIIAGPNGAGKTTFAREFLPQEANCPSFINADLIAQGLSPFRSEEAAIRAARLMLEIMWESANAGRDFAIETTLSGRSYAGRIRQWQRNGYEVVLFFLQLASADLAVARVADRVAQGGHHVPEPVIRRRFHSGLANFHTVYKPLVDSWRLYDNSGALPILISSNQP
ncbi:MAG: zeta toxin family protein [Verrucomicrobiales bacterium]